MLRIVHGNILTDDAVALVNAVNCVGVMGRGVARQFRDAFPFASRTYIAACRAGTLELGRILPVCVEDGRWIVHLPTKEHWRDRESSMLHVTTSVIETFLWCRREKIPSIAFPAVGCGNGKLPWEYVERMITRNASENPRIDVRLYAPVAGGEK